MRRGLYVVLAAALCVPAFAAAHAQRADRGASKARVAYQSLARDLRTPTALYREGDGTYGQAWPFAQALAAAIAVAKLPGSGDLRTEVRALVDSLPAYLDGDAYDSTVTPPLGHGGIQFYDDNEWLALDLLEASVLLRDPSLRAQAERVFGWITTGWDSSSGDACSGGVYWANTPRVRDRNTVSTANAALLAVGLYGATHRASYLRWAQRLYGWVDDCLADSDGLYFDHLDAKGRVNRAKWSYNQGAMIAAGALLYRATGKRSYLQQSSTLAASALAHYRAIDYDREPAIFVAIFFRDLAVLDSVQPRRAHADALADYVHKNMASATSSGSVLLDRAAAVQLAAQLEA